MLLLMEWFFKLSTWFKKLHYPHHSEEWNTYFVLKKQMVWWATPMNLWPEVFVESLWLAGFVKNLNSLLEELPFNRELEPSDYLQNITTTDDGAHDNASWGGPYPIWNLIC